MLEYVYRLTAVCGADDARGTRGEATGKAAIRRSKRKCKCLIVLPAVHLLGTAHILHISRNRHTRYVKIVSALLYRYLPKLRYCCENVNYRMAANLKTVPSLRQGRVWLWFRPSHRRKVIKSRILLLPRDKRQCRAIVPPSAAKIAAPGLQAEKKHPTHMRRPPFRLPPLLRCDCRFSISSVRCTWQRLLNSKMFASLEYIQDRAQKSGCSRINSCVLAFP